MKKRFKQVLIIFLITYSLSELMCFTVIKTGLIHAELPAFFSDTRDSAVFPFTYADINPYWGVWHYNYPVTTSLNNCINIECIPNSVGARDKERSISGDSNRVVVLGDSFMEGFGVGVHERASGILEQKTGKEFLNFACSDMGSTQEYLVYKHLASTYSHNTVLIGILPDNDFLNDNIDFDSIQTPLRYKPYWGDSSEIMYYVDGMSRSQFNYEAFRKYKSTFTYQARHFLQNTTCWFNVLYYILKRKKAAEFIENRSDGKMYSGYYHFTVAELNRLKRSLSGIKKLAAGKKIIMVTIPVQKDFIIYKQQKKVPLTRELSAFAAENNMIYYDLLTNSEEDNYSQLFYNCDDHWNKAGNKWASDKLLHFFLDNPSTVR